MKGSKFSYSPQNNGIICPIVSKFLAICLIMVIAGCKTATESSPMMKQLKVRNFTSQEMRIRVNELSSHFAHIVEASADEIMNRTTDPAIQRAALVWKIYAISECQSAATSADPLMAFIDMWTFILQMTDYFETGVGKDTFGELQPIAVNTSRSLEAEMLKLVNEKALPEGFDKTNGFVDSWVKEHPIKSRFYTRDSTLPLLADIYRAGKKGTIATMGSIDQGIRDISERISFLSDNLPRQARWQAEYLMSTTVSGQKLEETLNNVNLLVKSVDRMARVIEQSPEIIDKERTAVFAGIQEERKAVLKSISEQRIETIQEINKEILEVIKAIHEERVETVKELRTERIETLKEIAALSASTVEDVSKRMEGMVMSLFWRASLCLAGLVGVGMACGAGVMWMKARSNRPAPPTAI